MAEEVSAQRQQATSEEETETLAEASPEVQDKPTTEAPAETESIDEAVDETPSENAPEPTDEPAAQEPQTTPSQDAEASSEPSEIPDNEQQSIEQTRPPVEQDQEPAEPETPKHPEIQQLERAVEDIHALARVCEKTLEETATLGDQDAVQKRLKQYAKDLSHLPKALQEINDFRRHIPDLRKRAEAVRSSLVKIRGGDDDAITSEEARIIVSAATAKEAVMTITEALENAMGQVRSSTPDLLSLISYEEPGFSKYAIPRLRSIRVDLVSDIVHQQRRTVALLIEDLASLAALEEHVSELENV